MEKVDSGIVFSEDIYRILQGKNALDFSYEENGLKLPSRKQISVLRDDFRKDVNRFFKRDVTIFSEEDMDDFLYSSIEDYREYPHCFSR